MNNAPTSPRLSRLLTIAFLGAGAFAVSGTGACSGAQDAVDESAAATTADSTVDDANDQNATIGETDEAMSGAGPCAGTAIDRAVRCATAKGAHVLSFYRSVAEQERVRRENHCTDRCTGMAGCIRPTAGCTTSPHTRCRAVDLVGDGAPLSRAALRACGLAKTTAPHANHYDLVN